MPDDRGGGSPNVLLISLDTTRADYLGCYGRPGGVTPNLDRLAAEGIRFERAYSTAGITPVSHASLLTGLNPYRHGVRVFFGAASHYLEADHPGFASLLGDAGYRTAAFVSAYPASERFGMHHGFERFDTGVSDSVMQQDMSRLPPKDGVWADRAAAAAQRRADATVDRILDWLEGGDDRPFFLWAHFFDPHDTQLVPPVSWLDRFDVRPREPGAAKRVYVPEVAFMDHHIGRLFAALRESGAYENTLVVVTADHGQGLGDHGWFPHRILYQEQIRVPLLMRLPDGPRGKVVSPTVRSIDVLPTVLEALQLPLPLDLDGAPLQPVIDGREGARVAYAEALNTLDVFAPRALPEVHRDRLFAVADDRWKLIYHHDHPQRSELYDLVEDPGELRNLFADRPDQAARLLEEIRSRDAMYVEIIEPGEREPEVFEKLRSLGYVDG
ncbi:hypothetical protein ABI59_00665 [Acidobacteria bacterium Mor1]|nr:hypothetical protein ABI59_00665 [Acidobacteria bacterium Mor1]